MRIFIEYFIYLMNIIEIYLFVFSEWILSTLCLCQLLNKFYSFGFYSTLYILASYSQNPTSEWLPWVVLSSKSMTWFFCSLQLKTGYIGSVSFLETVLKVVEKLRSYNPKLIYGERPFWIFWIHPRSFIKLSWCRFTDVLYICLAT